MNKLVSRNSVLRFKEGKKIVKAKYGDTAPYPLPLNDEKGNPYVGMWYNGVTDEPLGTALIYNTELVRLRDLANPFYESAYFHRTPYLKVLINNKYRGPRDFVNSYEKTGGHPTIDKSALPKGNSSTPNSTGKGTTGKRTITKTSTPETIFAGYKIGRTGGLKYNIDKADIQLLIGTGQFTESDFANALAAQKALNRYFVNSGLGSIREDGAWGDLSRAALAFALSKSKGLTPLNNETTIVKTPVLPTYTPPTTPINLEVANLNLNVPTYYNFNRAQTRDWMRNNGIGAYSVSGATRAAVRRILGGQANDNDRLLVKLNEQLYNLLKGYYKQGGQLPSRNIIRRFKNRKFN